MSDDGTGRLSAMRQPPRTTCKICWCSVYIGEDIAWVIKPTPGIAHRECAEKAKKED